jgi:hypothetical protein
MMTDITGTTTCPAGPPGGGGGGGGGNPPAGGGASGPKSVVSSTACTTKDATQCNFDGSSNFVSFNLRYNNETGVFSGTMTGNQCSNNAYGNTGNLCDGKTCGKNAHTSKCYEQTFPDASVTKLPSPTPLRGTLGYSMYGVLIYGPFEAGFTDGLACNGGTCKKAVLLI